MSALFSLDRPITPLAPFAGGNGNLPPVITPRPFAPAGGGSQAPKAKAQNNQAPVIPKTAAPVASYPKPAAWVEKRITLCIRHHAKFNAMRAAFKADLAAWVESQPGYCPARAAQERRMAEIRRAHTARR